MCAAAQEIVGEGRAERARVVDVADGTFPLAAQYFATVARGEQSAQPQPSLFPFGVSGKRRLAASAERTRERALGRRRERRPAIGERRECLQQVRAIGATLDRERTLPGRRQAFVGIEQRANARAESEALQSCGSKDDRVVTAFVELRKTRLHVAAQRIDAKARMALAQLRFAAQARRADDTIRRQRHSAA